MEDLYSRLGASSTKEEVHAAIQNLDKGIAPGAFCKVLPDILGGDSQMINAMHADGAGTKSILAYLYWRQTGDIGVWKGIAQDALVMNLDDLLCIGARTNLVITSTIGRNKRLIPGEVLKTIIESTEEFCHSLYKYGVNLVFAGGETADVGDLVQTIIVDSAFTVRFEKSKLIDASNIKPGNVIVGLCSFGRAIYEKEYNSGIASNGITLARHSLLTSQYAIDFPEVCDPELIKNGGYSGKYNLEDNKFINQKNLGLGLLSPTRTFAPVIHEILETLPSQSITGIIHNTGGGLGKVKKFIKKVRVEKKVMWQIPEVFQLIQNQTGISWKEMMQTFNCGLRMEIYCDESVAETIIKIGEKFGVSAYVIGSVVSDTNQRVIVRSNDQEWSY